MLIKLIKHEFIATYRLHGIMLGGLIALAALARISALSNLGMLAIALYVVALVSSVFVVLVFTVRRFHQSLLSDQAYLTLMLPANAHQHLFAKIIVTAVWYVGLVIAAFLSLWIAIGSQFISGLRSFANLIGPLLQMGLSGIGINGSELLTHILVLLVIMGLFQLMLLYLCTTVGGQSGRYKRLIGIALYFGITYALSLLLSGLTTLIMPSSIIASAEKVGKAVVGQFIMMEVLYLLAAVGCYFLTARRLTHKFNLQ